MRWVVVVMRRRWWRWFRICRKSRRIVGVHRGKGLVFHHRTIQRGFPPNLLPLFMFTRTGRNGYRIRLDGIVRLLSLLLLLLLMLLVDKIKVSHRVAFGGGSVRVLTKLGTGKLHTATALLSIQAGESVVHRTPHLFTGFQQHPVAAETRGGTLFLLLLLVVEAARLLHVRAEVLIVQGGRRRRRRRRRSLKPRDHFGVIHKRLSPSCRR